MKKEIKIIKLYCQICQYYDNILVAEMQRLSNNFSPKFSDEECITVHLWGIANEKYDTKAVHEFIVEYWSEWFPELPGYESYVKRVNNLAPAFKTLTQLLISEQEMDADVIDHIIDSLPIMLANSRRSGSAKVAPEMCDKGYCSSKNMWYYGVKLHSLSQKQYHTLPKPALFGVTPASVSDITFAKEALADVRNIDVYGDKIYNDSDWFEYMRTYNNVNISAPIKLQKGQEILECIDRLHKKNFHEIFLFILPFLPFASPSNLSSTGLLRKLIFSLPLRFGLPMACFLLFSLA